MLRKGKTHMIAKYHKTDLVICTSYRQINTIVLKGKNSALQCLTAKFQSTGLDIFGHSRDRKTLF